MPLGTAPRSKLLRLLLIFRPEVGRRRGTFAAILAVLLAQIGTELLVPWPLKVVVDNVIRQKPLHGPFGELLLPFAATPRSLLGAMVLAIVLIAAANALLEYAAQAMLVRTGQSLIHTIRQRLYAHLQRLSFAFHTRQSVGDLTSRITSDINALQDLFVSGFRNILSNGLLLAGMVGVMLLLDWTFTLVALSVLPALLYLVFRYKPRVKQATRAAKKKEREMSSLAQETLVSFRVVQAFAAEDYEEKRFEAHGSEAMAAKVEAGVLQARFAPSIDLTLSAGTALVVGVGALKVFDGELSIGILLVFLAYLKEMYAPMKALAKAAGQLTSAAVSSELVVELLETAAGVEEREGATVAPRFQGAIAFEGIRFSYGRDDLPVLRDLSFELRPGQRCVMVGPTGAGKSTLVSLLPRFADPQRGVVRIDGHDIRDFTLKSLREQIAIVLQEAMLFHMTVRENIAYAMEGATEEQVIAAAVAANAHEFIVRLPQGYDTVIDERGGNLSGGQRQRITLARAFLRDAPILVLDEPTTGLDLASEALVLDAIERLTRGRTTLTIAHRLSTIESADVILVLADGQLLDRGTHRELMARSPRYRQLYSRHVEEASLGTTLPAAVASHGSATA